MFDTEAAMQANVVQIVEAAGGTVFLLEQVVLQSNINETGASLNRQWLYEFHRNVAVKKRFNFIKTAGGQCWFDRRDYAPSRTVLVHDYEVVPAVQQIPDAEA